MHFGRALAIVSGAAVALGAGIGSTSTTPKVGTVTQTFHGTVRIDRKQLAVGQRAPVYPGDVLSTDASGHVAWQVTRGPKTMTCNSSALLARHHRVFPVRVRFGSPTDAMPVTWQSGSHACSVAGKGNLDLAAATGKLETDDPVFEVQVTRSSTVLKVVRGVVIASGAGTGAHEVVVGRNRRTTIQGGGATQPVAIGALSPVEKASLAKVAAGLPPDTDKRPPRVTLAGPRNPSSLRTAVFTFSADEDGAVFSCKLDGGGFQLCTSPQSPATLAPGPHTFSVYATDASGNTSVPTTYQWTIDGSRIAFSGHAEGSYDIYTMNPDGTGLRRVTGGPDDDFDPAWSPSRKQIAFHRVSGDASDVYVVNEDGSGLRNLTDGFGQNRNPTWSPDGKRIAFESDRGGGGLDIWVMNADGSGARPLTTDGHDLDPAWSPDGRQIAFASTRDGNYEVYVMNADGSGQVDLTNNSWPDFGPAWSPDGRRIAFHSQRDGASLQIFVMNADGSNPVQLSKTGFDDANPSWAPDGGEIVFQSNRGNGKENGIYMLDLSGDVIQLPAPPGDDRVPDW
jgi:hypothetical protein